MSFFSSRKSSRKKGLGYYKAQMKKIQKKLDIREAKKKLETMKNKL